MSLFRTTAELATEVLRALTVLAADETIAATDETYVTGVYNDLWDELAGQNLAYWDKTAIPKVVFLAVKDLVALHVMGAYGQPMSVEDKDARHKILCQRLRKHTSTQATGHDQNVSYF